MMVTQFKYECLGIWSVTANVGVSLGSVLHFFDDHPERMEISQPRVARNELPWGVKRRTLATLKGLHQSVASFACRIKSINPVSSRFDATLSELISCSGRASQGSSFLATLG